MNIQKLCKELFLNGSLTISADDVDVNSIQLVKEYGKIKNYILHNCNDSTKIGIYLNKDYRYVLTMLAIMELGLTFIPLNTKWPRSRNSDIIAISECDFIISSKDEGFLVEDIKYDMIISSELDLIEKDFISYDNPLYIIFTSGSTGVPKGVVISREAYSNFLEWIDEYFFMIDSSDVLLNSADFTFDLSMIDIALLLTRQLKFYISSFDNNIFKFMLEIQTHKITTIATVPNNINLLLSKNVLKRGDISSLKYLLLGGARFSYGLYLKLFEDKKDIKVFNLYGPTEATVYCSAIELKGEEEKEIINSSVTIGKSIKNMDIVVHNDEVLIGGIQLMNEYLNNKKLTANSFIQYNGAKYYRTGDIGFFNEEGNIFIIGRMDDTIKCSGYRINLSDIDSLISKLDCIDECAVIAIGDELKENRLVAYLKLNINKTIDEIYGELSSTITSYQTPSEIYIVDNFPLSTSGKISKKDLKQDYEKQNN